MATVRCASCGADVDVDAPFCLQCMNPPTRAATTVGPAAASDEGLPDPVAVDDEVLPPRLRGAYRVERRMDVDTTQASLFVVVADGRRRVLKRYREAMSPAQRANLRNVLAAVQRVDDAHVIRVDDFDAEEGWELAEYVGGGTLADLMGANGSDGRPLDEQDVLAVVTELALALVALEGVQLSHGDIKPENVLVRTEDPLDLVLADFGLSLTMHASLYDSRGIAQPVARYAAPEMYTDTRAGQSDVWAVGLIALELLGQHPFDGRNDGEIHARMARRLDFLVDPGLATTLADEGLVADADRWRAFIRGALHPDAASRWRAADLLAWAQGGPGRTVPDLAGDVDGRGGVSADGALTVAGASRSGGRDLAAAIAADPGAWEEGLAHLRTGRLQMWARAVIPELAVAMRPDGEIGRIPDADVRLLRVLLWLDPELRPTYRGVAIDAGDLPGLIAGPRPTDPAVGRMLDVLAGGGRCAAAVRRPDHAVEEAAVALLVAHGGGASEALRLLLREVTVLWDELVDALREIGAEPGGARAAELRLRLLRRSARGIAGVRVPAPGAWAVLRRPRAARSVIRAASPYVRSILVEAVEPARPVTTAVARVRTLARRLRTGVRRSAGGAVRVRPAHLLRGALLLVGVLVVAVAIVAVVAARTPLVVAWSWGGVGPPVSALEGPPLSLDLGAGRTEAAPSVASGTPSLRARWRTDVEDLAALVGGAGAAFAPVVGEDVVLVGGSHVLRALEGTDGTVRWSRSAVDGWCPTVITGSDLTVSHAAPVVRGDTVVVAYDRCLSNGATVRALDVVSGGTRWTALLPGRLDARSPVVAERTVLVATTPEAGRVIALDAVDGRERWRHREPFGGNGIAPLRSDPIVVDGVVHVAYATARADEIRLVALDLATGERLGAATIRTSCPIPARARLIGARGVVTIAPGDGSIDAFRSVDLQAGALWTVGPADLGHPTPGSTISAARSCRPVGMAVHDSLLYVAHVSEGTVHALGLRSGQVRWASLELLAEPDAPFPVTPLVAGDRVYVVDRQLRADARILALDRRTGRMLRVQRQVPSLLPTLAAGEGRIHALTTGELLALW